MAATEPSRITGVNKTGATATLTLAWRDASEEKGLTFIAIQKAAGVMKVRSMQVL